MRPRRWWREPTGSMTAAGPEECATRPSVGSCLTTSALWRSQGASVTAPRQPTSGRIGTPRALFPSGWRFLPSLSQQPCLGDRCLKRRVCQGVGVCKQSGPFSYGSLTRTKVSTAAMEGGPSGRHARNSRSASAERAGGSAWGNHGKSPACRPRREPFSLLSISTRSPSPSAWPCTAPTDFPCNEPSRAPYTLSDVTTFDHCFPDTAAVPRSTPDCAGPLHQRERQTRQETDGWPLAP